MLKTNILNPTPARALISKFYYQLPNNGHINEGLLSCDNRYKEATTCALICIDEMIRIAAWGGDIDNEIEDGSKEFYMKVKKELIQIQNENTTTRVD